jgi:hypothetical protein
MCAGDQFTVARMDLQIIDWNGRQIVLETLPAGATVKREIHSHIGSHVEQELVAGVLANNAHKCRAFAWQVAGNRPESAAEII